MALLCKFVFRKEIENFPVAQRQGFALHRRDGERGTSPSWVGQDPAGSQAGAPQPPKYSQKTLVFMTCEITPRFYAVWVRPGGAVRGGLLVIRNRGISVKSKPRRCCRTGTVDSSCPRAAPQYCLRQQYPNLLGEAGGLHIPCALRILFHNTYLLIFYVSDETSCFAGRAA